MLYTIGIPRTKAKARASFFRNNRSENREPYLMIAPVAKDTDASFIRKKISSLLLLLFWRLGLVCVVDDDGDLLVLLALDDGGVGRCRLRLVGRLQ